MNVEQLHSDNNLRDAKMREANLDSHDYPLAYLTVSGLDGHAGDADAGQADPLQARQPAHGEEDPGAR